MAQTRGQRAAAQASKGLENVYLFVPNLIGTYITEEVLVFSSFHFIIRVFRLHKINSRTYSTPLISFNAVYISWHTGFARVFLALGALWTANDDPVTTFWLYFWSCFLDAWDGHAARYFNQSMLY